MLLMCSHDKREYEYYILRILSTRRFYVFGILSNSNHSTQGLCRSKALGKPTLIATLSGKIY